MQLDCGEWALAAPVALTGIWGGLSARERRDIRQPRRRRQPVLEPMPHEDEHEVIDELASADIEIPESDAVAAGNGASRSSRRRDRDRENELRRQRRAAARANPKSAVAVTSAGNGDSPGVNLVDTGSELAAWQPLAALLAAGAEVVEVQLTMAGQPWTLTRPS